MEGLDIFDCLENLESRVKLVSQKNRKKDQEQKKIGKLKQRYSELCTKKEQLKEKLENEVPVEEADDLAMIVVDVWKNRLQQQVNAYKLTGVSATRQEDNCLLVRFDTSFEGKFYEAYFVELVCTDVIGIRKHTLPSFIPLVDIMRDILKEDIQKFVNIISDHLQAYVHRREHMKRAQTLLRERGYLEGEITSTLAVDVIQLFLAKKTLAVPAIEIMLRFDYLVHIAPNSVTIKVLGDSSTSLSEKKKWQAVLTSAPMSVTFDTLCPPMEQDTLESSDSDEGDENG